MKKIMTLIALSLGTIGSFGILRATHNGDLPSDGPISNPMMHHQGPPFGNSPGEQPPAKAHQGSNDVQAIEGRVLDRQGNPVQAIKVIAAPLKGLVLASTTDKEGHFSIKDVGAGTYEVYIREKDGPRWPADPFYSGGLPTPSAAIVNVLKGQVTSNIVLQTVPKSAKLTGIILDAETNKTVATSRITVRRVDNPDYYIEMGPDEWGHFEIAVPTVPITIEVLSPQHAQWNYVRNDLPRVPGRVDSLKLNRGESRKLEVRLRKTPA
jgi:hypothetical protein